MHVTASLMGAAGLTVSWHPATANAGSLCCCTSPESTAMEYHCRCLTADVLGPCLYRHSQPSADSSGSPQAYLLREDSHSSSPDSWDPGHMQAQQAEVLLSFAERLTLQGSAAKVGWHCGSGPTGDACGMSLHGGGPVRKCGGVTLVACRGAASMTGRVPCLQCVAGWLGWLLCCAWCVATAAHHPSPASNATCPFGEQCDGGCLVIPAVLCTWQHTQPVQQCTLC